MLPSSFATSQKYPDQFAEVEMVLVIEKESVPPRISLELEFAQFSVAAGSSTTFNLILKNNGLIREVLQLSIEGIPMGWVSTPSPITKIEPGESKEIPVSISPPRSPESRGASSYHLPVDQYGNTRSRSITGCHPDDRRFHGFQE